MTSDPTPPLSDLPISDVIVRAMKSNDSAERRLCLDHIENALAKEGSSAIDDFDRFWLGCAYAVASGKEFGAQWGEEDTAVPSPGLEAEQRYRSLAIQCYEDVLHDRDGPWYDEVAIELASSLDLREAPGDRERAIEVIAEVNDRDARLLAWGAMIFADIIEGTPVDDESPGADQLSREIELDAIRVLEEKLAQFDEAREMLQNEIDRRKESFAILHGPAQGG